MRQATPGKNICQLVYFFVNISILLFKIAKLKEKQGTANLKKAVKHFFLSGAESWADL
jgi:hypothetical protein